MEHWCVRLSNHVPPLEAALHTPPPLISKMLVGGHAVQHQVVLAKRGLKFALLLTLRHREPILEIKINILVVVYAYHGDLVCFIPAAVLQILLRPIALEERQDFCPPSRAPIADPTTI